MALIEELQIREFPNAEFNLLGLFVGLFVIVPLFLFGLLIELSKYPEIEIDRDQFRLITPISMSEWIAVERIKRVCRGGLLSKRDVVEVDGLSCGYNAVRFFYSYDFPCFFIHPKINGYDRLMGLLNGFEK